MKKLALLFFLIPFCAGLAAAFDFGVVLDQTVGAGGIDDETDVDYSGSLIPWFSSPLGDLGDVFISAGLTAGYEHEEGSFVPELLRAEFSLRFNRALRLRMGRLSYADPLNFVVDGLFDGAQVSYNTMMGTFNAAFLYSGLLYKKTTRIIMTGEDALSYYDNDVYAGSRRLLITAGWEHPALMELMRLSAVFTGQFDLNDRDTAYNSEYLTLKASIPHKRFVFELGGAVQWEQYADETGIAFAGEIGASWEPPAPFQSQIAFNGRFASGRPESGPIVAFVPVTIMDHGDVLKAGLSGLSALKLDYTARIVRELSINLAMTYFVRSDKGTYMGYPAGFSAEGDNDGFSLGGELFGRVMWSPVSDLRLNAGGGVFLPGMGDIAPDAEPMWRMELNLILSLY